MSWIKTIEYNDASTILKKIYNRVKGPDNYVDNVLMIHSLRPHSLVGHMSLYKNVLHNSNNTLPKWYLEALGVYVSHINRCDYCVEHHSAGLRRLLNDENKFKTIIKSIKKDKPSIYFKGCFLEGMKYAKKITRTHNMVTENDIHNLRNSGFSDGEILEVNQVASYFNYVNRTVVGLGVDTSGDRIGLSPNDGDDPDNWNHE